MADEYHRDFRYLLRYCESLLYRFGNRQLGIAVPRLCQEPIRKVLPDDRMVGAAKLCMKHGIFPAHICIGIAAGYCYDNPEDAESREIQAYIKEHGIEAVVEKYSDLESGNMLHQKICEYYRSFTEGVSLQIIMEDAELYVYTAELKNIHES